VSEGVGGLFIWGLAARVSRGWGPGGGGVEVSNELDIKIARYEGGGRRSRRRKGRGVEKR
jgi:hypothetical protein